MSNSRSEMNMDVRLSEQCSRSKAGVIKGCEMIKECGSL